MNAPNRSVSCADPGMAGLHAVAGRQSLLQQGRELLGELLPVLVAHLVLEAVQDLKGGERRIKTNHKHIGVPPLISKITTKWPNSRFLL